jgi:hypothetical protein
MFYLHSRLLRHVKNTTHARRKRVDNLNVYEGKMRIMGIDSFQSTGDATSMDKHKMANVDSVLDRQFESRSGYLILICVTGLAGRRVGIGR